MRRAVPGPCRRAGPPALQWRRPTGGGGRGRCPWPQLPAWSRARFNRRTLTPASPRTPRARPSVFAEMRACTRPIARLLAFATRAAWMSALATLMWGARPLADDVTASAGTGASAPRPFGVRYAATAALMLSLSFWLVGPKLVPPELVAS